MISRSDALTKARSYVAGLRKPHGIPRLTLLEDETIERDFGWVFFYGADLPSNPNEPPPLLGNAPIIVSRKDGSVHVTGTAHPVEYYISSFERYGTPHPGKAT